MFSRMVGAVLLVGVGVVAVGAVIAAPRALRAARPLLRAGIGRGLEMVAQARGAAADFLEEVEDLVAEARAEVTAPRAAPKENQKA